MATGLDRGPIVADLRRRAEAATLVIGGRHLGSAADPRVHVEVRLDDAPLDDWTAAAGPFLRVVAVPAGRIGGEGYARLTVRVAPVDGAVLAPVAIEQFDLQSVGVPVWGFDHGWHEAEFDRRTGRSFRWTSGSADLRIAGASRDVELRLSGESPLKYVERAPAVVVRVGSVVAGARDAVGRFHVADSRADGRAWRLVAAWSPSPPTRSSGPAGAGSADRRELGLRLFEVTIAR